MCLSCGCNEPDERHGDNRNIIMQDLVNAAQANNVPVSDVAKNLSSATKKVMDGKLTSSVYTPEPKPKKITRRKTATRTKSKSKTKTRK
jgi:hypothetical protein